MREAVIVDIVRSPMSRGREGGALAGVHSVDLLAQVLRALVDRTGIEPADVGDVIVGCVAQIGVQSGNVGRQAWLAAGYPVEVPAVTIERKCGSGQQAVDFAVQGIMSGAHDVVIAAGVESMSAVGLGKAALGEDPQGPAVRARFPDLATQGVAAERIAHRYGIGRDAMDEYAAESHRRAHRATSLESFRQAITPITRGDGVVVDADETIRRHTTAERLSGLRPAFETPDLAARFPELEWQVTAGTSSQVTDGAAATLIMSADAADRAGLRGRARVVASAVVGDDPAMMLTGPIPATRKVLDRAGLSLADICTFEVNEAFASVPLAWQQELGVESALTNPWGGAIALGHPLGASGLRLLSSALGRLDEMDGRYALQTMCEAGGMANAFIIERL